MDTITYFVPNKEVEFKKQNKKLKLYDAYATYYHRGGKKTANNDRFQPYSKLTCAASHEFPFGTKLKVTNVANGKSVIVTVVDRGAFYKKRGCKYDLDLTYYAFSKISSPRHGRIKIRYEILN